LLRFAIEICPADTPPVQFFPTYRTLFIQRLKPTCSYKSPAQIREVNLLIWREKGFVEERSLGQRQYTISSCRLLNRNWTRCLTAWNRYILLPPFIPVTGCPH